MAVHQTGINVFDAEGRDHGKSKLAAEAAIKDTLMCGRGL
jgi:hypothetical protein